MCCVLSCKDIAECWDACKLRGESKADKFWASTVEQRERGSSEGVLEFSNEIVLLYKDPSIWERL